MSLRLLGEEYGTDKVSHGFCEIYDKELSSIRESSKNILEIGVFFGASILMWKDYFPNAKIHGMDTFEGLQGNGDQFQDSRKFYKQWTTDKELQKRIDLHVYNQGWESDLWNFVLAHKQIKFDVIIDDGSHLMRDQQLTFKYLFPRIVPGGKYIIEDVHSSLGAYDCLPDFSNTTLTMIKRYNSTGELKSDYTRMYEIEPMIKEMKNFTVPETGSMTCIIDKV